MKLRIVSDGTAVGTKLLTEDGQVIERVTAIKWECASTGHLAAATITAVRIPVDIIGKEEE